MVIKIQSWLVHIFTACGALAGFLSLIAISSNNIFLAFLWLAVAFLIDGIDGAFARKVNVKENLPQISGTILDNIVDYLNYVFIPAFMIYWLDLVIPELKLFSAFLILIVSCYTFTNLNLKTEDNFFMGFPALWNIVVFYLFVLKTSQNINLLVIIFFGVMTFVPIKYVHPLRVEKWKNFTIFITVIWSICTLALLLEIGNLNIVILGYQSFYFWIWLVTTFYFFYISLIRSIK